MRETPHKGILDREEPRRVVGEHFARQMELLRDLADYGSNLVIRAYGSCPKMTADVVVCGVLLKQLVAMVDAVEVLLSAGCGLASFLPARTAFEASIYVDWILDADSERRATRYVVANLRDGKLWAARIIPGTVEEAAFSRIAKTLGVDVHANRPNLTADATTHLVEVSQILAQPNFASVDKEFTVARGKRKRDPEWYELDDLTSIRQVADKVGRLAEYEFFYSRGSQVAHTGTYEDHVRFDVGKARLKPIRHLADINVLLNFIVSVCVGTYKKTLARYRPEETSAFKRKYLEDWREPFMNVVPVKYYF